jgi:diacylglycerol kinase family enzyme
VDPEGDSVTASPTVFERLAAALALALLGLAIVTTLVGALEHRQALVFGVVGVLVIIAGSWTAAVRRGPGRVTGLAVAACGLALLVIGVATGDLDWWRAGLGAVLAAASGRAARYALRRRLADLEAAPTPGALVPAARHPVLIMNPKSGGGKATRFRLAEECGKRGIEPVMLEPGDDLLQLAENAIARGADVIGMAGGDGSQALVATVASRHGVPTVVVPAGTRNHFALDLGLDRDDVVGALDAFGEAVERRIDMATVNGRVFVNNASLGLYAEIVQSAEYRDAKLRTAAVMLPQMKGPDAKPFDLRHTGPDGGERETADVILVSNNPYVLTSLDGAGTRERIDRGTLGVATLRIGGAVDLDAFIALEAVGQARRFHGWDEWTCPRFQVDSTEPVPIGVDGEALTLDPPLVFESVPGAVRVRLPLKAPGVSPAARRLGRSTPVELWHTVLGRTA